MSFLQHGERYQASLGGEPRAVPTWLRDSINGSTAQIAKVKTVDYPRARVEVSNSNGSNWARVLKTKTSGTSAGRIDMPNVGDIGIIIPANGDLKSQIWLGCLNSIEPSKTLEHDGNFVSADDLIHRVYEKHESDSFWWMKKLGDYFRSFKKKAAKETDPSKKNLDISVGSNGQISVIHYRGSEKKSFQFSADQSGHLNLTLYGDDGVKQNFTLDAYGNDTQKGTVVIENDAHQVSMLAKTGSEILRYMHKKKNVIVQVTQDGDLAINVAGSTFAMEQIGGDISMNHISGSRVSVQQDAIEIETQDGSTILVSGTQAQVAIKSGQSVFLDGTADTIELTAGNMNLDCDNVQLGSLATQFPLATSGLITDHNTLIAEFNLFLTHYNALLSLLASTLGGTYPALVNPLTGIGSIVIPVEPALPIVVATPGTNVTAQVTGA